MVNAKQGLRQKKASMILATIKKATDELKEIDEKFLISQVCLEFGAGRRYVKEIIEDLINVGKVLRTDKGLVYNE